MAMVRSNRDVHDIALVVLLSSYVSPRDACDVVAVAEKDMMRTSEEIVHKTSMPASGLDN